MKGEKALDKRRVTITIRGRSCSFFSDDEDAYIAELAERANATIKQFSGNNTNAVLYLTDALMRAEREKPAEEQPARSKQNTAKKPAEDKGQVSVWELLKEDT